MTNRAIKVTFDLPDQHIEIGMDRGWGDNPAFYAYQVEEALDKLKTPIRNMIEAVHGRQSAHAPLNDSNPSVPHEVKLKIMHELNNERPDYIRYGNIVTILSGGDPAPWPAKH